MLIALITVQCKFRAHAEGDVDCGTWVSARSGKTASNLEHYLQGLLNGMAIGSGIEFWTAGGVAITAEQAFLWTDNYCRSTPLSTITIGATVLFKERTGHDFGYRLSR